ncbi:MAG: MerR family transcriptional regulator [Hyphomicrobiales bacterium]|nr:MerR family transcriptional regulator [Hyphomicrobiales bacterium]
MDKNTDAFRTISEAAEELDLPQHVLRFWETRFTQIKPLKRGGGRRYYRPVDLELLRAIRHLLYGEGYTIKGVQRILKEQGARAVIDLVASGAANLGARASAPAHNPDDHDDDGETPGPAMAPPAPQPARETPQAYRESGMGSLFCEEDIHRLEAALADLAECKRILHAAIA